MSLELTDIMTNKASKLTVGGLFSGIGGLELAFQNEGFKVAWANDIDKYTHQVYQRVVGSDHYIGNKPISLEYIMNILMNLISARRCINCWISLSTIL